MKALSLTQPWATLVVLINAKGQAEKQYETRSWQWTPRQQIVAIHAAKTFPKWAKDLCKTEPFRSVLAAHNFTDWAQLPLGEIVGCARIAQTWQTQNIRQTLSSQELAFGDYSSGRIAIELCDPVRVAKPISCRGALGLWQVPPEIEQQIREQLKTS
ncbi:MAG: 2-oxoglutarate dehydrogenase E1 [Acidobacteria bacterium]|nr:2-oxoglutarate dehydrogenase E1 [Acidobacteriota bacterium]